MVIDKKHNKSYFVFKVDYFKTIFIFLTFLFLTSCQKEESFSSIEVTAVVQHISEFGAEDGAIDIDVTGGVPPFSFLWSNNETTEDLTNIAAGTFSVIVYDQKNQSATDTFIVSQPAPDSLTLVFHCTNPSETGMNDGTINSEIGGGYPPFTYFWSNGASTQNLEGLTAGSYTLTINDNRGQTLIDSTQLTDMVSDVDGNTYSIKKIGDQTWMGENLRVRHAPDGSTIESFAYTNDTVNVIKYGRLYRWNIAMNGSTEEKAQGICPDGWHIPSDDEFKELEMFLGMTQADADRTNTWRGSPVGTLLKAGGSSGYNAQMGGRMTYSGSFNYRGEWEYMWTSTEYSSDAAWRRCLATQYSSVGRYNSFTKSYAFSVRCIKDN
jgi:uncharacterized protein (TIGR02145 family)